MSNALFIFRRDLRLQDNTALYEAIQHHKKVMCIFIFTEEQLMKNPYKSDHCVQFMMSCLELLDHHLQKEKSRLFYFYGDVIESLESILNEFDYDSIYINRDYTPYSIQRDQKIEDFCDKNQISFNAYEDILLNPIESITTGNGTIYQKFTPYFIKASKIGVDAPQYYKMKNLVPKRTKLSCEFKGKTTKFYTPNSNIAFLADPNILDTLDSFDAYNHQRNDLTYETTHLSAYIKFGQVSIREVYQKFQELGSASSDLIKQLYWRDFYYNISYVFNYIFQKKGNLKKNYDAIEWENNNTYYQKWCKGETGFPIVDAGMRQMNTTGYMHNRARLITASFLVKLLLNDWKRGEMYFAKTLIDYDPCVNTGNWGWVSSSGADSQPYYRIFNPWLQSKTYDPEAKYIHRWIPALKNVEAKHLHAWDKMYEKYPKVKYPKPIIDYATQKRKALDIYGALYS